MIAGLPSAQSSATVVAPLRAITKCEFDILLGRSSKKVASSAATPADFVGVENAVDVLLAALLHHEKPVAHAAG